MSTSAVTSQTEGSFYLALILPEARCPGNEDTALQREVTSLLDRPSITMTLVSALDVTTLLTSPPQNMGGGGGLAPS